MNVLQPIILQEGEYNKDDLSAIKRRPIWRTVDIYDRQSRDLAEIQFSEFRQEDARELAGDWVYYPWNGTLLHCLTRDDQLQIRTNRNRNLVTSAEQSKLLGTRVAVAGLSVGGSIAISLAYSGIGSELYLADHDELATSNLNRVRATLADVGTPKAGVVARQIWELDPYAKLHLFTSGVNDLNLDDFLGGAETVDVVIDEIDDFQMKVRIRHAAKTKKVPVLMFTGLGDSVLVDIERYDTEHSLPIFNGLLGKLEDEILADGITPEAARRYAVQIVGTENVPTRALESLLEMGKTLVGRPQLASTVTIEGGLASFIVRKLILDRRLKSGRYRLSLNQLLSLQDETSDSPDRAEALSKLLGG